MSHLGSHSVHGDTKHAGLLNGSIQLAHGVAQSSAENPMIDSCKAACSIPSLKLRLPCRIP